jgi:hypothetical protein
VRTVSLNLILLREKCKPYIPLQLHAFNDDPDRRLEFCEWFLHMCGKPGSSVSILSGYGLDDRVIQVRSPAEAKGFLPLASGSRPALGPIQHPVQWILGSFPRGVTLTTHTHLVPRSRMSRSYISFPPSAFVACNGTVFLMKKYFFPDFIL